MKPLKQQVSISLDGDVIDAIKDFAEKNDRSFSGYINLLLRNHITQKRESDKNNTNDEV